MSRSTDLAPRLARALVASLLLLSTTDARASACCTGTTTTLPTRLGACERFSLAAVAGAEASTSRWTSDGAVAAASPAEASATGSLAAGLRLHRTLQLGVALPVRYGWRTATGLTDAGGGVGDVQVRALLEPVQTSGPSPVAVLGIDAPTGRDWAHADGPLLADVTGRGLVLATGGVGVEQTGGKIPWSTLVDLSADVEGTVPARLGVGGSLGVALGSAWSVSGVARHEHDLAADGTARTRVGATVVYGVPVAWRTWAAVTTDLPVPGLGRATTALLAGSLGFAWIG
jgi:hypothetical protein